MKRPIKPFVVEVRKGQKKNDESQNTAPAAKPDARNAAAEALRSPAPAPIAPLAPPARTGRILASLDEPKAPLEAEQPLRRRGRPPGSRNKPKSAAPAPSGPPKRRGRPPKSRSLPLPTIEPATAPVEAPAAPNLATPSPSAGALPRNLQRLVGLGREGVAAHVARVPAGERWKRRLRGPARLAFERRHSKT